MFTRFKEFCRRNEISVGTSTALISTVGWIGTSVGATLQNASEVAGIPTWAATGLGMGSLAFMWVGRYGADIAKKLSGWRNVPAMPTITRVSLSDVSLGADPEANPYPADQTIAPTTQNIVPADFTPDAETVAALGAEAFHEGAS